MRLRIKMNNQINYVIKKLYEPSKYMPELSVTFNFIF